MENKMKKSNNYFLTLNGEIIFTGNKKEVERKRKEYKRKGIKVIGNFSPYDRKIGTLV